jgi:hypothetical protein
MWSAAGMPSVNDHYYGLSRLLYRTLAAQATRSPLSDLDRQRLVEACEYVVHRLADEPSKNPRSGRLAARWLYREVEDVFALADRPTLFTSIRGTIAFAVELIETTRRDHVQRCLAQNRFGAPCQREARPGSEFCPSHRHLELGIAEPDAVALTSSA